VADGTAASRGTETSEDAGARPDPVAGDAANKLEARTVRALLRALRGDVIGATARDLAGHAVVSPRAADRLLKRLLYRDPALVATVDDGDLTECAYVLTDAGEQELERLERHIAAEAADMDRPPRRVPCGTR
jgi:DNA-binding MarR family transcriptional regulator